MTRTSTGSMPCSRMTASSVPARPSSAPWTFGCRVFTRPFMISGKPVSDDTSVTGRPVPAIVRAVPPVETREYPRAASSRARSTIPVLSETESNARRAFGRVISSGSESVLAQLFAQGAAIDAEDGRRAALVAVGIVHHGLEQRQFHFAHDKLIEPARAVAVQAVEVAAERLLGVVAKGYFTGVSVDGTEIVRAARRLRPLLRGHCQVVPVFVSQAARAMRPISPDRKSPVSSSCSLAHSVVNNAAGK